MNNSIDMADVAPGQAQSSAFLDTPDFGPWRAWHDFAGQVRKTPDALALRVDGRDYSYAQLNDIALTIAAGISVKESEDTHPVTSIFADRSVESYAGVLAALMLGHAYVPLNPIFPDLRNRTIVTLSGASFLVSSPASRARAESILAEVSGVELVLGDKGAPDGHPVRKHDNPTAYILFTSGSTGLPKGVPISHANLHAYLVAANQVADFRPEDRFSQNFDLTFDVSVHDLFISWRAGGQLIVPSAKDLEEPAKYVVRDRVTCWFSVPSLGQKLSLQGALKPGALSQLRLSFFVGEALPLPLARAWQQATGNIVENWYGPTEATIVCLRYRLPEPAHFVNSHLDLTPIGECLPGMTHLVLDEENNPLPIGGMGELLVAGPQVASGYLNDAEKTAKAFVTLPGHPGTYYRTGDRVIVASDKELQFVDRLDNQIKIRGYRVEIGEIEAALRKLTDGCNAIVTPLPLKSPNPTALAAAVEGWTDDAAALHEQLKEALPAYMVPTSIRFFFEFPRNGSGKADRPAIGQQLAEQPTDVGPAKFPIRKYLIDSALRINPALSREAILQAVNLMDAGMDSLAFTEFALTIEKSYNIPLDQDKVFRLSEMPINGVVRFIKNQIERREKQGAAAPGKRVAPAAKLRPQGKRAEPVKKAAVPDRATEAKTKKTLDIRARRVIECVTKLPAFLDAAPHPLALFFGSSGTMNGVSTAIAEREAAMRGVAVTAVNLGSASLSNLGTAELVQFACDAIKRSGKPVAFAVFELEPAELSTLPYPAHSELVDNYLKGVFKLGPIKSNDDRSRWLPATGGNVSGSELEDTSDQEFLVEATWIKKREREDVETFLGVRDFVPMEVEIWLAAARAIAGIADRCISFVHPIRSDIVGPPDRSNPENKLGQLLNKVVERTGMEFISHMDFGFEYGDFRDYNHANQTTGPVKLTSRLVAAALGGGEK